MNHLHDAFNLSPFAMLAAALALFAIGVLWSGAVLGGIIVASAAIARELATYRLDGHARLTTDIGSES